jgi:hypothetical protein
MEKSLSVRIQYFADLLNSKIMEVELGLLTGKSYEVEAQIMQKSEIYQEMMEKFEELFEDILYTE